MFDYTKNFIFEENYKFWLRFSLIIWLRLFNQFRFFDKKLVFGKFAHNS